MAFDVFKLRDRVVGEYRDYVESFVHIYDQRIEGFVRDKLDQGELWPDAVLQLNPAYEPGPTLGELAAKGELHWGTARFFGEDLRLYRHQEEAIRAAARGGPVITSTGTGSGKSLTYLVPIVDHVLKNQPRAALGAGARRLPDERADQQPARGARDASGSRTGRTARCASTTTPGRTGTRRATRSSTTRRTSCSPTT